MYLPPSASVQIHADNRPALRRVCAMVLAIDRHQVGDIILRAGTLSDSKQQSHDQDNASFRDYSRDRRFVKNSYLCFR